MKKFLSVFMLAIFASVALQFSAMKTARAEYLVYCFSEDNLEFYVDLDSMKTVQDVFGDEGIKVTIHAKGYSFTIDSILTCPVIEITFFSTGLVYLRLHFKRWLQARSNFTILEGHGGLHNLDEPEHNPKL